MHKRCPEELQERLLGRRMENRKDMTRATEPGTGENMMVEGGAGIGMVKRQKRLPPPQGERVEKNYNKLYLRIFIIYKLIL
ncbi:hypothetical protein ACO22_06373 [Paracoccidioides brasiliensis]|uniref:Uncharacterized protein n=1 Tax=Paracoccidioides brasiliensis TaxID=121759 RepID=A0A1D2J7R6_PARBR|nr:hypothetical protein ACO22_06373 [Paracoccidioides brasiliensis]